MLKDGALTDKQVWGLAIDNESRIWLGGENEIAIFSPDMKLQKNPVHWSAKLIHTHMPLSYLKIKKGIIWLGLYKDGILTCDPQTEKNYPD